MGHYKSCKYVRQVKGQLCWAFDLRPNSANIQEQRWPAKQFLLKYQVSKLECIFLVSVECPAKISFDNTTSIAKHQFLPTF